MKKYPTVIFAFILALVLALWGGTAGADEIPAEIPAAAEASSAADAGQPGAAEPVQWDLTQDLNSRYDNVITLLRSDAISIYANRLKYEDTDEGRALAFYLKFTNLTEKELELEVHSIAGRVSSTWEQSLKAGGSMQKNATGYDCDWNGLIGETADCCQGTYQLTVKLDGEVTDTVQFDLYISENTPFCNITATSGAAVPADVRGVSIKETVLADEDLFRITANCLEASTLYVIFENKGDSTLTFSSVETDGMVNTVNGYANDTGTYEEVGPGESIESDISLGGRPELGIEKIADIQHGFEVRDEETYDLIARVPVHLQTSAADYDYSGESFQKMVQDLKQMEQKNMTLNWFTDQVEYECAGIRILSAALISRADNEPELYLEMENTTDENLYFYSDAVALNGLYITLDIEGVLVPAGKKAVSRHNRVYGLVDETVAGLFGLEEPRTLTVIGVTTTDLEDSTINIQDPLGSQTFTLQFTDGGEAGVSYQALEEMVNEGGIRLDKVSELMETEDGVEQYFAIVNSSGRDIECNIGFEGNKVNGSDVWMYCITADILPDGATGIMILRLYYDDLHECGISSAADITDLEAVLDVSDTDRNMLLEKTFSIQY